VCGDKSAGHKPVKMVEPEIKDHENDDQLTQSKIETFDRINRLVKSKLTESIIQDDSSISEEQVEMPNFGILEDVTEALSSETEPVPRSKPIACSGTLSEDTIEHSTAEQSSLPEVIFPENMPTYTIALTTTQKIRGIEEGKYFYGPGLDYLDYTTIHSMISALYPIPVHVFTDVYSTKHNLGSPDHTFNYRDVNLYIFNITEETTMAALRGLKIPAKSKLANDRVKLSHNKKNNKKNVPRINKQK
jgi:hypothetical protein